MAETETGSDMGLSFRFSNENAEGTTGQAVEVEFTVAHPSPNKVDAIAAIVMAAMRSHPRVVNPSVVGDLNRGRVRLWFFLDETPPAADSRLVRGEAPFRQIAHHIADQIRSGQLKRGELVPSTRQIEAEWGVARATAARALEQLGAQGLTRGYPGRGTVVL